jgi:hypothetical protein
MLKNFSFFSNVGRARAKSYLAAVLFPFLCAANVADLDKTTSPASLPEVIITGTGSASLPINAKIGDRITFQADLKSESVSSGEVITLRPLDETSSLENQGWYLVQGTLNQSGVVRFIASPLKAGTLTLPPLVIVGAEGVAIARTAPLSVSVEGIPPNESEKPDLVDVVSLDLPLRYWVYLGLLLLGALMLLRFLYRRFIQVRNSRKPLPTPLAPAEPDHIVAFRKIDDLFANYPFSAENIKIVSFGISEIIKEFFSRRFKIDALESTTDEMIMLLRREALSGEQLRAIQLLFNELDQFKFTKIEDYPPIQEETHTNLKIKATMIIQKWAITLKEDSGGISP